MKATQQVVDEVDGDEFAAVERDGAAPTQVRKKRKDGIEFEADLRTGVRRELEQSGVPFRRPDVVVDKDISDSPVFTTTYIPFELQGTLGRGRLKRAHAGMLHVEKQVRLEDWRERKEKTGAYERHQAATSGQREALLLVDAAVAYARERKKEKPSELLGMLQIEAERRWLNEAEPEWVIGWDKWYCLLWALEFLPEEVEWSYWIAQVPGSDPDPRLTLLHDFADQWVYNVVSDRCVHYDRAVERRYDDRITFVLRYRHFDYDFWKPRKPIPAHHYPAVCLVCESGFFPFRNKDLCHECASDNSWLSELFQAKAKRLGIPLDQFVAKKSGGTSVADSRRLDALADVVTQTKALGATVRQIAAVLGCSTGRVSDLQNRSKSEHSY